jgi:PBP1b-binding outer membrane lipoprotein LpoB
MARFLRYFLVFAAALVLSGCVVADGVAHVVKKASESDNSQTQETAAPAADAPATTDAGPPPPTPSAAPRDSVQVEQLPPPAN